MNSWSSSLSLLSGTVIVLPSAFSRVVSVWLDLMNVASIVNLPSAEVQIRVLAFLRAALASFILCARFSSTVSVGTSTI